MVVVGSGIMGERLGAGNAALALLANSIATGLGLFALIVGFAPYCGTEFNPLVSCVMRPLHALATVATVGVQVAGAVSGVWLAHAMFDLPILQHSMHGRGGAGRWIGEGVATFGLLFIVLSTRDKGSVVVGACVGAYIAAAYWFTSSTSFANPAVTIARAMTDTFAGIAPADVAPFVAAQIAGASLAWWTYRAMSRPVPDGDA
ncbi:MAG: aquaporin family protein [Proteobacteria bacterium]|nr:aquaporin family protein [Pseudomonadota bacterium]